MNERTARQVARAAQADGHCENCGSRTRNGAGKLTHERTCKLVKEHSGLNLAVKPTPIADDELQEEDEDKLYPVPTIGESIETLRHILATGSATRLPGGLYCDTFSASAIVSVYDALGPEARAKFADMLFLKGQHVAFKLIEKHS